MQFKYCNTKKNTTVIALQLDWSVDQCDFPHLKNYNYHSGNQSETNPAVESISTDGFKICRTFRVYLHGHINKRGVGSMSDLLQLDPHQICFSDILFLFVYIQTLQCKPGNPRINMRKTHRLHVGENEVKIGLLCTTLFWFDLSVITFQKVLMRITQTHAHNNLNSNKRISWG